MFEEFARLLVWLLSIILLAVIILPQMIRNSVRRYTTFPIV